ncbi:hypothetical protein KKG46_04375 [Patescibacteria group bacterium]|nr:hypothetical protein [Patescibacteria group bacterium]
MKKKETKKVSRTSIMDEQKMSEKEHQNEVDQSLRTIYQEDEGEMPDMSKLDKIQSRRWIWVTALVSGFILILIFASWLGFSFYKSYQGFTGKGLIISVEGPETIALGQETTYFVNYKNPLNEPLAAVDIRVNFPSDFIITQIIPSATDEGNVWKIGALAGEEMGTIKIKGRFIGALGTISAVQAIATYRPANYSSNFEAMATKQISYNETVIEGWLQVPEKGIPGDHVALLYHIKNTDQEALKNVEVRIILPDGFTVDPIIQDNEKVEGKIYSKTITNLASGSSTDIGVTGVFSAGYGGTAVVKGEVGTVNMDGAFLPMQKAEAEFPVLAGDLSLKLVVNGLDNPERSITYGDVLQAAIGYENTANESLKNVKISVLFETVDLNNDNEVISTIDLIDWDKWDKNASNTLEGNTVSWDQKVDYSLADMAPSVDGDVSFSVPIITEPEGDDVLALRITAMATVEAVGDTVMNRTIKIAPYIFKLKSDARLSAEVRYFSEEGAPYGEGPLPPLIGQNTTYRIIWKIDKNVHVLKNLDVTTVLPRNVDFGSIATTTAGELSFDEASRELTWKLNRLPEDVDSIEAQFNLELTPNIADDGRFASLMGDITFQATDEDIKESLLQVVKSLTTDLQNDENAKGKGVVRKVVN